MDIGLGPQIILDICLSNISKIIKRATSIKAQCIQVQLYSCSFKLHIIMNKLFILALFFLVAAVSAAPSEVSQPQCQAYKDTALGLAKFIERSQKGEIGNKSGDIYYFFKSIIFKP